MKSVGLLLCVCVLFSCAKKIIKPQIITEPYVKKSIVIPTKPEPVKELPPIPNSVIIVNQVVHFDFDRAVISFDQRAVLDAIVETLQDRPDIALTLTGGCCPIGEWGYNKGLGLRRGNAVYNYLNPLLHNEIIVTSVGEDNIISSTDLWKNRRCEIKTE